MGVLLIVLGLVSAGIVADFIVENATAGGVDQTFELFGGSFALSTTELVIGAAVLGAIAITLFALGLGLLGVSMGRRRERAAEHRELESRLDANSRRLAELERRNAELARENAELGERYTQALTAAEATGSGDGSKEVVVVDAREEPVAARTSSPPSG
jgi:hypothetical protein